MKKAIPVKGKYKSHRTVTRFNHYKTPDSNRVSSDSPLPVFQAKTAKGHCRSTRSPWTGRRPGAATRGRDGRRNDREVWNGRLAVPGPDQRLAVTTTRTCT